MCYLKYLNRRFGLLVVVLSLVTIQAQAHKLELERDSTASYVERLEQGIEAFYRANWKRAGIIFNQLQASYPQDSRAYFFNSMIPFWKYYFGDSSSKSADIFLKRAEKAIQISQNQLKENPHDTTIVLMLSGLYGYQSLVAASEKKYRTAIQSGMTGFKYTRQLLSLDADDPKALIGKGMFYYMLGSVPSGLQWVTNMVGMSGDRETGFKALKKAAQSGSYVRNDAQMILAYLYEREEEYPKALSYLKRLVTEYPENIIFQYNYARILEKCAKVNLAKRAYQKVLSIDAQDMTSLQYKSKKRLKKL